MKILQVVRQFYPSVGGIESAVLALSARLRDRGHQCEVITLRRLWDEHEPLPPRELVAGVPVRRIGFLGGRRYFLAPEVLKFAGGHDLIHVHAIDFFVEVLTATRWRHRTPLIVSTHGGFFHTGWARTAKHVYFHTVTRLALTQAARVICDSAQDDRVFAPIVPRIKRITIPNGVEDRFFGIRKSLEPGLLVMVGRIAEHNGIDKVIRLLPTICRAARHVRLLVVGPDWEGRRTGLEALARSLGVADRVSFTGPVSPEALSDYLRRAHLVLAASAYEGFGIAVVEAMASASVVVASDIEAHRELIRRHGEGLLADFGDERQAVEAVVAALQLPMPRLLEIGDVARASASRFSWDRVTDLVEGVYRESARGTH